MKNSLSLVKGAYFSCRVTNFSGVFFLGLLETHSDTAGGTNAECWGGGGDSAIVEGFPHQHTQQKVHEKYKYIQHKRMTIKRYNTGQYEDQMDLLLSVSNEKIPRKKKNQTRECNL